jgi:putative SOS response-associated peptidase YedK
MCGRYRLTAKERYIAEHFELEQSEVRWSTRYNIAPTQQVAVVRRDANTPRREFSLMRWGLIPHWAKDSSIAAGTVNAMSETAAQKPAFRDAFRSRRCLLPADGFYEWKKLGPRARQPYNFGLKDEGLFAFAGLWDRWRTASGDLLETCTILTTAPNPLAREVHDRMPVILRREDYDLWLDSRTTNPSRLGHLLRPFDAVAMRKYPVTTRVGNPAFDNPECVREARPLETSEPMLF